MEISPTPPNQRLNEAERIREHAAREEKRLGVFPHPTNGDEARAVRLTDLPAREVEPTQPITLPSGSL